MRVATLHQFSITQVRSMKSNLHPRETLHDIRTRQTSINRMRKKRKNAKLFKKRIPLNKQRQLRKQGHQATVVKIIASMTFLPQTGTTAVTFSTVVPVIVTVIAVIVTVIAVIVTVIAVIVTAMIKTEV